MKNERIRMVDVVVCIKQVPEKDVKMNWEKGTIVRGNAKNILNPDDYHAIELGLKIIEKYGGNILAITLGPPQSKEILREAYALGVNRCVLVSDPKFAGSDTLITSKILYRAIKKVEPNFDIVITGRKSIDGDTGNVSYQLAEFFDIPHFTQIHKIDLEEKCAIVERIFGHEYQKVNANMPIIIAADRHTNSVRFPSLKKIKHSYAKEIQLIKMEDIGGSEEEYGLKGSPTITLEGKLFQHKRKKHIFQGNLEEKVDKLINKLKKYNMLGN